VDCYDPSNHISGTLWATENQSTFAKNSCTGLIVNSLKTQLATTVNGQSCALNGTCTVTANPTSAQYKTFSCQPGLGDGLNAIPAGTYLETTCYNDSGVTVTLTAILCLTDNNGGSTMAVTNGAGTALLTGAVTCTNAFVAGTQSATTTIASGDYLKFTFVADGTSKQTTWVVTQTK
jgi:hypothetical protein